MHSIPPPDPPVPEDSRAEARERAEIAYAQGGALQPAGGDVASRLLAGPIASRISDLTADMAGSRSAEMFNRNCNHGKIPAKPHDHEAVGQGFIV